MDKLGNVMKGLGCCSQGAKEPYTPTIRYCAECPYLKSKIPCTRALARDALELLKEQEARVMTLEEITKAEVVWTEYSRFLFENTVMIELPHHPLKKEDKTWDFQTSTYEVTEFLDEYGKTWRCWTSRPTEEQRRATPWQS